jgi:hypothetical protein
VRIVYCHACGAVSTNVWAERDICTRCGHSAERMDFHRPWQSYAAGAALIGCAALFIAGPFQDVLSRSLIFVAVLVLSVALSSWGFSSVRKRVLKEIAARGPREGNA